MVHILPEEKLPFALPIDTLLKNHESNERKCERRNIKQEEDKEDDSRA